MTELPGPGRRGPRSQALHATAAPRGPGEPGGPGGPGRGPHDEPDLLRKVRAMLRESHPLPLVGFASSLLAMTDPRPPSALVADLDHDHDEPARTGPSRTELLSSFLEIRRPETSAVLAAIAELLDDEVSQQRIRRELSGRPHKPPRWLRRLSPPRVDRALEVSHVLGDGDNVFLDVRTGNDDPLTVIVYIDHNLGTLVKDAFVVDQSLAALEPRLSELSSDEPDTSFTEVAPADARARITAAIELGEITFPPLETDTWPSCKPLIEWVLRHLPRGGRAYGRDEWSESARDELIKRFVASAHAPPLADEDLRDLAHVMVWFACDYGPGDPLRWSPVSVEIFLTDFLARKAMFPTATLAGGPAALEGFVRFAHNERGIPPSLTADTLESIVEFSPAFLDQLDDDREDFRQLITDVIRTELTDDGIVFTGGVAGQPETGAATMRALLIEQVGDGDTLDSLDIDPLPDEPLDLTQVPDDVHERIVDVSALIDACCHELLDIEHRTACRRLLADVAAADPQIFRRGRDETAAAAIAWLVAKANHSLSAHHGGLTAKRLVGWFGVGGSVSQRAETMLRALGLPPRYDSGVRLRSTRYLVAAARAWTVDLRERFDAFGR